ncbi:diguanylate cyclase [Bacillus sp. BGMRC 2118]|nr:diguanylate cyclase [Bacillus sp. BGMRC 2118]
MNSNYTINDLGKATQSELEIIWNNSNDAIFLIAPNGAVLKANPAFEKMLGYSPAELEQDPAPPILPEHFIKDQQPFLEQMKRGEARVYYEAQRVTKEGKLIDIVASYRPYLSKTKELQFIVAMYKDVTRQKQVERQLIESEQKYRFIAENTTDIIQVLEEDAQISYISPSSLEILQLHPDEVNGKSLLDYIHGEDHETAKLMLRKLSENKTSDVFEIRYATKDFTYKWFEVKGTCENDYNGKRYILVSRDISDRKNYEEELKRLAFQDPLTGLPNRRLFIDQLMHEIENNSKLHSFTLFYLDLDNLKKINDQFGHNIGDKILIEFGEKLKQSVRETDIVCRMGGDEFVILASGCNHEKAHLFAERIMNTLTAPVMIEDEEVYISTSIGIFVSNSNGTDNQYSLEQIIKQADDALYAAKNNGKNRYEFSSNSDYQ